LFFRSFLFTNISITNISFTKVSNVSNATSLLYMDIS
jgi:hypothetical protein